MVVYVTDCFIKINKQNKFIFTAAKKQCILWQIQKVYYLRVLE